jgi:predicted 3-demethylubiquinone-9 3-methyltransferase (glyoxalase superfamily)
MRLNQKVTPCLWFDGRAEEAAKFYVSLFDDSRMIASTRQGMDDPAAEAANDAAREAAASVVFELAGQIYLAFDGGPRPSPSGALSFFVECDTQDEVDRLWIMLGEGGVPGRCGGLTDRYGLSWRIAPPGL